MTLNRICPSPRHNLPLLRQAGVRNEPSKLLALKGNPKNEYPAKWPASTHAAGQPKNAGAFLPAVPKCEQEIRGRFPESVSDAHRQWFDARMSVRLAQVLLRPEMEAPVGPCVGPVELDLPSAVVQKPVRQSGIVLKDR